MGHKYLRTSLSFPKHCQCNSFLACLNTQIKPVLTSAEVGNRQIDMDRDGVGKNNHTECWREHHMFANMLKRMFKFKYHIDWGNTTAGLSSLTISQPLAVPVPCMCFKLKYE